MRILIISNYYPPAEIGGWEQLTCDVARELLLREHHVHIITSNRINNQVIAPEPNISRVLHLESPDHVNYLPQYSVSHRWQEKRNINHLRSIVSDFRPDIVFINGMWNLPHSLAQSAEKLVPGRVVYYLASYWPTELDAHTAYWSSDAADGSRRLPKRILGRFAKRFFINNTPRNQLEFTLVLCVSQYVQRYLIDEANVPPEQTRIVHNGIDLKLFEDKSGQLVINNLNLLYAGRLSPDKGVHTILESLAIIRQENPLFSIDCSIYGDGAPEYKNRLMDIVTEKNLEENIHFKGIVPRYQMPQVFIDHHVLIFPSIWNEPLARIIQEAMACGLVVIGTNTGGTDEILEDGITGFIFEPDNAQMLAEKILMVLEDADLRNEITLAARRKVELEFSLPRMVDEIEQSFAEVLNLEQSILE